MYRLFILVALVATALAAVTDSEQPKLTTTSRRLAQGACGFPTVTETQTLFVGRDQVPVGSVSITLNDASLSVTYNLSPSSGCTFSNDDLHVELVNSPLSRVIPGQFSCKSAAPIGASSASITCPSFLFSSASCCGGIIVYTHASLSCPSGDETAFSGQPACGATRNRRWCNAITLPNPCECGCSPASETCIPFSSCPSDFCDAGRLVCSTSECAAPSVTCDGRFCNVGSIVCSESLCTPPSVTCGSGFCNAGSTVCSEDQCTLPAVTCGSGFCNAGATVCSEDQCTLPSVTCGSGFCNAGATVCSEDQCTLPSVTCGSGFCNAGATVCSEDQCTLPSVTCGSGFCNAGATVCSEDQCISPRSCDVEGCPSVTVCPGETCVCPNNCPDCFIPDSTAPGGCRPDNSNPSCEPCGRDGNDRCREATGDQSFKCCPLTSSCKSTTIPTRGVSADAVTFICSSNCGGCDSLDNRGVPVGCAFFQAIALSPDTDSTTTETIPVC